MNFFKNLFFLSTVTEREVASQAQHRVRESMEAIHMEKILKEKLENQIEKICNDISKEKAKEIQSIQKIKFEAEDNIENQVKEAESFMNKNKNKIEKILINTKRQVKNLIKK